MFSLVYPLDLTGVRSFMMARHIVVVIQKHLYPFHAYFLICMCKKSLVYRVTPGRVGCNFYASFEGQTIEVLLRDYRV